MRVCVAGKPRKACRARACVKRDGAGQERGARQSMETPPLAPGSAWSRSPSEHEQVSERGRAPPFLLPGVPGRRLSAEKVRESDTPSPRTRTHTQHMPCAYAGRACVSERVCPCSLSPVLAPVALPFLASPRGLAWQSPDSPPRRRTTPPPFTCSRKPAEPCRCTARCAAGLELVGGSGQGVCRGDTSSAEAVAFGGGAPGPSAPRPGRPSLAPPLHTHTVWPGVTAWGSPGA